ncbi:putative response regulator receiver protein [Magnetofaba australis IT-1]|uniref:Putative response regulator receiver protein n=1 Tax=Magnetofaba australis IT-1 TaxID=1434232 RepID=A0A1Y2K961_9PROT|nr:putative response regulator receiver protein [Magnetofaba australis IT-1]
MLIVDDVPGNINVLINFLQSHYQVSVATTGQEALDHIRQTPPDLVLLDILLPDIDGWSVLKTLKEDPELKEIPIIIQTVLENQADFNKGISLGAYYFLTKPVSQEVLLPLMRVMLEEQRRTNWLRERADQWDALLPCTHEWRLRITNQQEVYAAAKVVSCLCAHGKRVAVALVELLANGLEHGIARITFDEKTQLMEVGKFEAELERRLALPENRDKFVSLTFQASGEHVSMIIEDPGNGFNWRDYMDFKPERLTYLHGRGVALANSLFSLTYSDRGNRVELRLQRALAEDSE